MIALALDLLLVYVAYVCEAGAGLWPVSPTLLPLFLPGLVAVRLARTSPSRACAVAALAGLGWDALSSGHMGSHVLLMLCAALLWRRCLGGIARRSLTGSALFVLSFTSLVGLIADLLQGRHAAEALLLTASRAASTMLLFVAGSLVIWGLVCGTSLIPRWGPRLKTSQLRWLD